MSRVVTVAIIPKAFTAHLCYSKSIYAPAKLAIPLARGAAATLARSTGNTFILGHPGLSLFLSSRYTTTTTISSCLCSPQNYYNTSGACLYSTSTSTSIHPPSPDHHHQSNQSDTKFDRHLPPSSTTIMHQEEDHATTVAAQQQQPHQHVSQPLKSSEPQDPRQFQYQAQDSFQTQQTVPSPPQETPTMAQAPSAQKIISTLPVLPRLQTQTPEHCQKSPPEEQQQQSQAMPCQPPTMPPSHPAIARLQHSSPSTAAYGTSNSQHHHHNGYSQSPHDYSDMPTATPLEARGGFDIFPMPPKITPAAPERILFSAYNVASQVFLTTKHSFALTNLKPLSPGHVLVCPIRVCLRITDLTAEELYDLFAVVQVVERMLARKYFREKGDRAGEKGNEATPHAGSFNVAIQDGPGAGQTVPHVHVHVIPRIPNVSDKPISRRGSHAAASSSSPAPADAANAPTVNPVAKERPSSSFFAAAAAALRRHSHTTHLAVNGLSAGFSSGSAITDDNDNVQHNQQVDHGDEIYRRMAAEDGNVGGALWDSAYGARAPDTLAMVQSLHNQMCEMQRQLTELTMRLTSGPPGGTIVGHANIVPSSETAAGSGAGSPSQPHGNGHANGNAGSGAVEKQHHKSDPPPMFSPPFFRQSFSTALDNPSLMSPPLQGNLNGFGDGDNNNNNNNNHSSNGHDDRVRNRRLSSVSPSRPTTPRLVVQPPSAVAATFASNNAHGGRPWDHTTSGSTANSAFAPPASSSSDNNNTSWFNSNPIANLGSAFSIGGRRHRGGRGRSDSTASAVLETLPPRPVPGGQFAKIEDSERQARGMSDMEAEAEEYRQELTRMGYQPAVR